VKSAIRKGGNNISFPGDKGRGIPATLPKKVSSILGKVGEKDEEKAEVINHYLH